MVDEVASTTTEALVYVEKYKPNIVLMDIKLNGSPDGTEVVEAIQQKYKVPVIYLISHSDEETLQRAQATKPYGYDGNV
ncbi:MAG TPA: response regulator transcription factor [Sulfurospirillum arcachonense]|nr:response regulator transcription factor [Sulfurospirillum arcachonense]